MSKISIKQILKRYLPPYLTRSPRKWRKNWTMLHSPRFNYPQSEFPNLLKCCIAYTENGGFCVPLSSSHRPAARKILAGYVYEPNTIAFIADNCGDGDIVHAGTYFGDFLPALSRACASGAMIWAFEPNPENYRCAAITRDINALGNINLYNAGLGERSQKMSMITRDARGRSLGGASRLIESSPDETEGRIETVGLVALDDVLPAERNVSLIQLDVEGFEQQALSGALSILKRARPILILESLPDKKWLSDHILALDYNIDGKVHGNTILLPDPN